MASIEPTAYPRFPRPLTLKDLQGSFTPRPEEIEWVQVLLSRKRLRGFGCHQDGGCSASSHIRRIQYEDEVTSGITVPPSLTSSHFHPKT